MLKNRRIVSSPILFNHSFISKISITPLKNYSEELPNPARLKRKVLRLEKNVGYMYQVLGKRRIYVCMYVYMFLCMCVCIHVCIYVLICKNVCMYVCMYVCM